jgi:hypothetical protein
VGLPEYSVVLGKEPLAGRVGHGTGIDQSASSIIMFQAPFARVANTRELEGMPSPKGLRG